MVRLILTLAINNLKNHDYGFYLIIVPGASQNLQCGHSKTVACLTDATHKKAVYWHVFIRKRHVRLSYIRLIHLTKHQLSIGPKKKKQIKITEGINHNCTKNKS